ncbi:hypothetical protein TWF730_009817 [Orbilia blumenaviensis]|uniref:Uncharacterized protein n=1 Tax=Orbilia blumenaviensis TaxID=1796055 RepID=A0AAV9UX16_9PEZI
MRQMEVPAWLDRTWPSDRGRGGTRKAQQLPSSGPMTGHPLPGRRITKGRASELYPIHLFLFFAITVSPSVPAIREDTEGGRYLGDCRRDSEPSRQVSLLDERRPSKARPSVSRIRHECKEANPNSLFSTGLEIKEMVDEWR